MQLILSKGFKFNQEHFENYMGDILDPTKILGNEDESFEDKFEMDPASFVASKLNLGGTHYSLDAACASALYVLKVASDHLLSGRCDMMLAGASTFPEPFFGMSTHSGPRSRASAWSSRSAAGPRERAESRCDALGAVYGLMNGPSALEDVI